MGFGKMIELLVGLTLPGRDKGWALQLRWRADRYALAALVRVLGVHVGVRILWRTA